MWKSFAYERDICVKILKWRVDNGRNIKVYEDGWFPCSNSYKVISSKMFGVSTLVSMLISDAGL